MKPAALGLLAFAVAGTALYLILPLVLAPIWDGWIGWFPILVGAGASIVAGHVTGRVSGSSRLALGFLVGFIGIAAASVALTSEGSVLMVLPIAVVGGVLSATGSALAPKAQASG
jgi:hypothetical protein